MAGTLEPGTLPLGVFFCLFPPEILPFISGLLGEGTLTINTSQYFPILPQYFQGFWMPSILVYFPYVVYITIIVKIFGLFIYDLRFSRGNIFGRCLR